MKILTWIGQRLLPFIKPAKAVWISACCPCVFAAVVCPAAGIVPAQLQCESKSNPVGLSETNPRLSWQVSATNSSERGQYQSAYQIQVASTPQLLAGNVGNLWDTGEVMTNQTSQIPYGGSALAPYEVCYWHVQVWDQNGHASGWSSPATWSMGILSASGWIGQWIGRDDATAWDTGSTFTQANWIWFPEGNPTASAPVATRLFRKTFTVPTGDTVSQAVATMVGDNMFTLYVNGQVALSVENPNYWQNYGQADISPFLVPGTNVLAVAVTNTGSAPNPAGLIGSFDLTYSNGQTNSFHTDGSWLSVNQLFSNWYQTNFNASGWSNAMVLGGYGIEPWGNFINQYLEATMVRKDFTLSQMPTSAVLFVTGQGLIEPHLNGVKVGNDYFIPGWTDYRQRLYYQAYNVTPLLQAGSNTLGAILGDGWYRGNVAEYGQNFYGSKTRLLAQLYLAYANGTNQIIASDPTWQAGFGPLCENDIQAGETYDARLEATGWDSPGYNNPSWTNVSTGAQYSPIIQASPVETVQTNQYLTPVSITQPQPGLYVLNFGQNISGWVALQVTNQPAGRRIVMRFGEWLNPDGTIFRDNLRNARAMDTYICKGGGVETWTPRFTYHGFQYMEVQGLSQPPTATTFTAVLMHTGLSQAGSFQCSNNLINQIYSNMLWSVQDNHISVPTDCDQRNERAGWCDGLEVMRTAMFNEQAESFFSKWAQDIVDTKAGVTTSDFGQQAPVVADQGFSAGWQDAVVFVPYWIYQTYGDLRPAQQSYTNMVNHLNYYATNSTGYIGPNSGYGDWVAIDGSTPLNLISTAFYARCAYMMSVMAQGLGKTADAATYGLLFTNICSAFQNNFVSNDGTVGSGSEGGYALALAFNLLTPAEAASAKGKLAAAVMAQNGYPSTGMVTTHLLLPSLQSIGRSDLAYGMLEETNYPSWGFEANLGASTIFELWNSVNADGTVNDSADGMNSLNHANFGTCAEWFYRGILGINPLEPGFSRILIAPQIGGGLTWAQGYYNSIQGPIASAWRSTNNTLTLNVTIPANTTAEIDVPTTNVAAITESGVPAASSPGVAYIGVTNGVAIFDVGSGNYYFSSPFFQTSVAPPALIITTANQTGTGTGTFYPSWTIQTNGSLIAGQLPNTAIGNFSEEVPGRNVSALTISNNLGITLINGPYGISSSTNYVTCGNGTGPDGSSAGSTLIYTLTNSALGFTLTNITVYGGWANNGRDQQAYTISYSTVTAPANFILLGTVNYTPAIGSGVQSATRVTMTSSSGVLASNVAALKFDFTSPPSENGYCGYAAITVFGTPSLAPAVPATSSLMLLSPLAFALTISNLVTGRTYVVQGATNLASGSWVTETNFVSSQATFVWSNFMLGVPQEFFRVLAY